MSIRESLWSGNAISLSADVVVGSAFQVDAGRPAQRRRGRLHRADLPVTRPLRTFDERQGVRLGPCEHFGSSGFSAMWNRGYSDISVAIEASRMERETNSRPAS
jgi:hypothetical protein